MYETVISNGFVIDPANKMYSKLNIGITDGKIALLSPNPLTGRRQIDADGQIVCPGFVDMHMHEDELIAGGGDFNIQIFDCMLKMGVTTAIGGNCGIGPADPVKYLQMSDDVGLPVNIGLFLAHGQLRGTFGEDKYGPIAESHIQKMAQKLDEGAGGRMCRAVIWSSLYTGYNQRRNPDTGRK